MIPADQRRWALSASAHLHWRDWNHEHVVYNEASGDTHLLDDAAAATLRELEQLPSAPLSELRQRVAHRLNVLPDEAFTEYLEQTLNTLQRLELVSPKS